MRAEGKTMTTEQGTYTYTDDSGYADSLYPDNTVEGTYHYFDEEQNYYVFIPTDKSFNTVVHEGNRYYYAQEIGQTPEQALEDMAVGYL
jgi:hypothetical protein